jgi:hypothetical protein
MKSLGSIEDLNITLTKLFTITKLALLQAKRSHIPIQVECCCEKLNYTPSLSSEIEALLTTLIL